MTGILKKSAVRLGGACRVDPAEATASDAAGPEARIVEKTAAGVLIEVRCACGRCTYVQAKWPAGGKP
jgi:hypothetical protein